MLDRPKGRFHKRDTGIYEMRGRSRFATRMRLLIRRDCASESDTVFGFDDIPCCLKKHPCPFFAFMLRSPENHLKHYCDPSSLNSAHNPSYHIYSRCTHEKVTSINSNIECASIVMTDAQAHMCRKFTEMFEIRITAPVL